MSWNLQLQKYTQRKAKELNIRGWCKNTDQGTVIGQLEGQHDLVFIIKDWLKKTGSPSSRIEKVEFKNEREIQDYTFKNFSIKH